MVADPDRTMSTSAPAGQHRDAIAVGASMGGTEALRQLIGTLPADLPAAVFVVRHTGSGGGNALARVLDGSGPLRVVPGEHDAPVETGRVYVAPADFHMLVRGGRIRLARGPRENRARPSIDPLFRSVGVAYQGRAIGVVLTGLLDDGAAGLAALVSCGGTAVVQSPEDAAYPEMPRHALAAVPDALQVPLAGMAAMLDRLARQPPGDAPPLPAAVLFETDIAECAVDDITQQQEHGDLVPQVCPDCGGPLWQMRDPTSVRFRCHTGHAFSSNVLLSQQREGLERHMWAAMRALRERARLLRRMASLAREHGRHQVASQREEEAASAEADAVGIRAFLLGASEHTT